MDNQITKKGIALYTALYVGTPNEIGYEQNETYQIKIVRLQKGQFLIRRKDGSGAIVYDNADLVKKDWHQMIKIGIMNH
jgi:hypothetical protein